MHTEEEHAADASERRTVLVVRFAVHAGARAVTGVVDDFVVERAYLDADGQHVIRVLEILGRDHDMIVGDDQRRSMLRPGLEHDRLIVTLRRGKVIFIDQNHVTAAVGKDRGPAVAVDVVNGVFFDNLKRVAGNWFSDEVEMIVVGDEEDATVEDVDPVIAVLGPAREHDSVSVCGAREDARAGGGDPKDPAIDLFRREVDHREVRLNRVGDDQATDNLGRAVVVVHLFFVVMPMFVFVLILVRVLVLILVRFVVMLGRHRAERGQLKTGVLNRLSQVQDVAGVLENRILIGRFESCPIDDHKVRGGDRADVRDAEIYRVRVSPGGHQRAHVDTVAADLSDPVGNDLG